MTSEGRTLPCKNIKPPVENVADKSGLFLEVRSASDIFQLETPEVQCSAARQEESSRKRPALQFGSDRISRFIQAIFLQPLRQFLVRHVSALQLRLEKSGRALRDLRLCPCESHFVAAPDKKKSDMTI
jgi:hypothetical protein